MEEIPIEEIALRLLKIVEADGSELGRDFDCLLGCYGGSSFSEEFEKAIEKEMREQLEWFDEEWEIVEKTETYTTTYKSVEPK